MSVHCSASSVLRFFVFFLNCWYRKLVFLFFFLTIFLFSPQVVNVLRSQLNQLDEIKRERETLEGEIKGVTFDMQLTFLTALAQSGAINEEQLSTSQLDQLYGEYNQRVQASLRRQEELLGQVQVSSGGGCQRSARTPRQRGDLFVHSEKLFHRASHCTALPPADLPPGVQQPEAVQQRGQPEGGGAEEAGVGPRQLRGDQQQPARRHQGSARRACRSWTVNG